MAAVNIFYGSVYGSAQNVAQEIEGHLSTKGLQANVVEEPTVDDFASADRILVISSTTGQGDIPPNLEWAVSDLAEQKPDLTNKPFAVAALGDSSYGDSFCGAGKQIYSLLESLGAKPVADLLEVDSIEVFEPEDMVIQWFDGLRF
jgi:flavodoxin